MNFEDDMQSRVTEIETVLAKYLPREEGEQKTVLEAMNYSVRVGGKRLRPMLMKEAYVMFGGNEQIVEPFMAALEMIHTYSLVHDDLEAMDNDAYRRGHKTTHVLYGEAMAILAGDGLLNLAFETAMRAFSMKPGSISVERALQILGRKAGVFGMVGGQVCDVEAEDQKRSLSMEQLLFIHENKTAALIQAALTIGAVLADASQEQIDAMERIGSNVGLAFQIQDDILDVTSTLEELGKPIGSDEKNHKTTYVTLVGLGQAQKQVEQLSTEALALLDAVEGEHEFLRELLKSLIHRRK